MIYSTLSQSCKARFIFSSNSRLSVRASHDCDKHEKPQLGGFLFGERMKTCSRCHEMKPLSEFHKRRNRPDGHTSHCKQCHNSAYYDVDLWREKRLKREYRTDSETYDRLYKEQGGKCALCGCAAGENGHGRLALDHDHENYKSRGLLCFRCNTALGAAEKIGINKILYYLGIFK